MNIEQVKGALHLNLSHLCAEALQCAGAEQYVNFLALLENN